ncbi:hypothetical protein [Streptomyces olivaceus]|uniref:hypothetical protein n=1 Tax=Streptomyces olivaceus TaxID=47716 RepID=UPI0036EA2B44
MLTAGDVNALPASADAQLDAQYLTLNTDAGMARAFRYRSAGVDRWQMQVDDTPEAGSNAGSNFQLSSRNDDGSFNKTVVYASRASGQVAFGTTVTHGSAAATVGGALGLRDSGSDPTTTSGGVFLYSKGGVPYFRNADGTSFPVQPVSYPVSSVNGDTGHVTLGASDVGALPAEHDATLNAQHLRINSAAGTLRSLDLQTAGTDRWTIGTDDAAEPGSNGGSNLRVTARNDDGSRASTPLHITRGTGQVSFGTESKHGSAIVTTAGPLGVKDSAADPPNVAGGFALYSKEGKPFLKQGDGTVFQVGAGGGTGGAVQSVNGKTGVVSLTAADVGAVPTWGGTVDYSFGVNAPTDTEYGSWYYKKQGKARWVMQVSGASETGADAGSNWTLENYDDAANWKSTVLYANRASGGVGVNTTTLIPGSALTVNGAIGARNLTGDPAASSAGAQLYAKAGLLYVKQGDGTVFQVQAGGVGGVSSVNGQTGAVMIDLDSLGGIGWADRGAANGVPSLDSAKHVQTDQLPSFAKPSDFDPTDLGLKAWSSDPAMCSVADVYPTSGQGRVTAVKINEAVSVSNIVWYFKGYAGGLRSGSWAGIYNASGALVRVTGDLSTAAYEPQEQHATGGGNSWSKLTSAVTLQPGIYYVVFRMVYNETTVDGPAMLAYDNQAACPSRLGFNNMWRWASLNTTASSAPSSISTSSFVGDPKRFWVGLA